MTPDDRTPAHVADMLQFIVEAATRIDAAQRPGIPNVPWRQIIGVRNILAHGYEQIEHESLYRTTTQDLAAVEAALRDWLQRQV